MICKISLIIHVLFFIIVANPCDRKKCEWLCLLSPSGPVCMCPNGRILDNGTCVEVPTPTLSPVCEYTAVTFQKRERDATVSCGIC